MMKKLFITVTLLLTTLVSFAQIPKPQTFKDFSTWSVSPFFSLTYENTDVEDNDPFYKRTPLNRGFGLEVSKQLSHFTSLQLNAFRGDLETEWGPYRFNSKLNQYDLRFRFSLTNGAVFRRWQSTQIYGFLGYGFIAYDATKSFRESGESVYQVNDMTRVIPMGFGAKYRLGNRTSLSAEFTYNVTNTDNLDAWSNALSSKDGYTRTSIVFTYNLGKNKILEWDQPWQYLVPETVHDTTVVMTTVKIVEEQKKPEPPDSIIIYYLTNNYQIEAAYFEPLDNLLARARDNNWKIDIMAYCDSTGSDSTNYKLVTKRADGVLQYAKHFVSENDINIYRYDESWAVYAPHARNRKVIVKLLK